jgi:putative membrane protein
VSAYGLTPSALAHWELAPGLTAALLATTVVYLLAAARTPRWPGGSTAAFLAGMAVLAVALESGLHAAGEQLLGAHMVQHLLLTVVAPPLLVLGRPLALSVRAGPRGARRPVADVLRSRPADVLTHPVVAFAVFALVLTATHVPAFYDAALRHEGVHDLEHLLYVSGSLLFWQVVLAPEPQRRRTSPVIRLLMIMGAMVPMAAVGVALLIATSVLYPPYAATAPAHGVAVLVDQQHGGSVMWLWGTSAMAVLLVGAAWSGLVREERRQVALEASLERLGRSR